MLITVDAANLWRATEAGLLEPIARRARPTCPRLRDPAATGTACAAARTIMRSTERVGPDDVTTYEGLGDPRWNGRLCLRSGTSEYNVSFVADRLAKDGREATEEMLRSWMANDPEILGSDVDVLEAIADGDCDVGLTNHYYLGREKEEDPDFPVEPVWADQDGRGTHVNLSGIGVVRGSDQAATAQELIEFLVSPAQQQVFSDNNHEFPASASPPRSRGSHFKADPIDVEQAGARLDEALDPDGRGGLGLTRRLDGWAVFTLYRAAVAGPLIGLPLSFVVEPGALSRFSGLVPEAVVATTAVLLVGVGVGTLVLGTALAALVSFCDFPGRGWIEWALVLPLAMPGYVFTLFALGLDVPGIRSELGAVVRVHARALPVRLPAGARGLPGPVARRCSRRRAGSGSRAGAAIVRVAIPLARPAILGGVALALMEALADFGTVNLLGVRTFTDAIYRVWFTALDRDAAMQLATLLVSVTLTLLLLERLARGRARHHQQAARGDVVAPVRLHGLAAVAAAVWAAAAGGRGGAGAARAARRLVGRVDPRRPARARVRRPRRATACCSPGISALLVPLVALLLAYGVRASRSRSPPGRRAPLRSATACRARSSRWR